MGAAPSHTAQANMPQFQNPFRPSPEPGKSNRLATAPVATMTESTMIALESVKTLKGVVKKSTLLDHNDRNENQRKAELSRRGVRKVQVGFPSYFFFLFVCMVALISVVLGHLLHP
ncbi:Vesicle-associated membrane-protein-associated protein [Fagus crenata]